MKSLRSLALVALLASTFTACNNTPAGEKTEAHDAQQVQTPATTTADAYKLTKGTIKWEGAKPTGKHAGTLSVSEGAIQVANGAITGGKFTIDMASVNCTDLTGTDKAKLEGHLKSPDFFAVDSFPKATFEITKVAALPAAAADATHTLSGNLTLRGVTKNVDLKAKVAIADGKLTATTPAFVIDRTSWNVRYGSKKLDASLKDKFINDDMGLAIELEAAK